MPPGMGQDVLPHVVTFQGILRNVARTYYVSDEAMQHSWENARFMRNDPGIMECLEQRQRSTALLGWHLEAEDEKNAAQKTLVDELSAIIRQIPNFLKYRENLLYALWYGKYAVAHRYRWKTIGGKMRVAVERWRPVNGDKLVFRYDDGTGEYDDDQVGIRVGAGYTAGSQIANRWVIERFGKIAPTDHGLAYFLEHWERPLLAIHKHMIEDAEYEAPDRAGAIHGVGIRNRLYWLWYQKQETLAWLMEYLERSAFGMEIWSYPAGNAQAKADTLKAAEERIGQGRNIVLVPRHPDSDVLSTDVKRIEPGMAGADALDRIIREYFGWQIKRYILGQILTSETASTGLGSGVATIHLDTYLQIVRYDAINLGETLTTDLVQPLLRYNWPKYAGCPIRFVIETESPDVEGKLVAWERAYNMGLKLRAADVAELIGAAIAQPDEDTLQNPQAAGQPGAPGPGGNGQGPEMPSPPSPEGDYQKLFAALSGRTEGYRRLRPGMERLIYDRRGRLRRVERYRASNRGIEGDDLTKAEAKALEKQPHPETGKDAQGRRKAKGKPVKDSNKPSEPWQMTRREWLKHQQAEFDKAGRKVTKEDIEEVPRFHLESIRKALEAGKPVPDEVLESFLGWEADLDNALTRRRHQQTPGQNAWDKTLAEAQQEEAEKWKSADFDEQRRPIQRHWTPNDHRRAVICAIEAGVPVRPKVLADYPDLKQSKGEIRSRAIEKEKAARLRTKKTGEEKAKFSRAQKPKWDETKHPRGQPDNAGQFAPFQSLQKRRVRYKTKKGEARTRHEWQMPGGATMPEHVGKLRLPPGWKSAEISTDPAHHVLARGIDAKGREQRIYSPDHVQRQAAAKFARVQEGIEKLAQMQAQNKHDIASGDKKTREAATVWRLVQATGIRPGSERDTKAEIRAYGATTLLGKHVVVDGSGNVRLRFTGKKGVSLDIPIHDDKIAADLFKRSEEAGPDGQLFATTAGELLDYSHTLNGGGFKTKDFRTIRGTLAARELVERLPRPETEQQRCKAIREVARQVSELLGNTLVIALQSYIDPHVFDAWKAQVAV